ncbi:platelet-activating factor acetylhydrolase isoform II [Glycomyces artemisiae]|uniref:Platelet-activating factor acetylhydrolase isoform II n=1 Tax=Glycomyces artemisiae TaxID=1076443 RepID=A0A2T0UVC5_9ACTN|nr:platelet-activating factor acetylhydrolase isoform II [Glycomyces artemisiae]
MRARPGPRHPLPIGRILQRSTRRTVLVAAAAAAALGLGAVPAAAQGPEAPTPLAIPEPTGAYATGTTAIHLVDEDRADVWVPAERRELMVTMWYPTADDGPTAPYMTAEESALFGAQLGIPADLLAQVQTNSVPGAEPLADDGSLPLVVLSPGFSFPRATLTGLAEELASQGYAVAAVGHNYEAPISFPDRTTECITCEDDIDGDTLVPNRAADLDFVVEELEAGAWDGADRIDFDRIAVGGHSIGGASAHRTLADYERFDAGFNLDGTFFALDPKPVREPFLMVGAEAHGQPGEDDSWDKAWKKLRGWKRWITVDGTGHSAMTDLAPLAEQAGLNEDATDGFRSSDIARTYVTAFLDAHLRCEDEPVLDGPSAEWPEVEFHNP